METRTLWHLSVFLPSFSLEWYKRKRRLSFSGGVSWSKRRWALIEVPRMAIDEWPLADSRERSFELSFETESRGCGWLSTSVLAPTQFPQDQRSPRHLIPRKKKRFIFCFCPFESSHTILLKFDLYSWLLWFKYY